MFFLLPNFRHISDDQARGLTEIFNKNASEECKKELLGLFQKLKHDSLITVEFHIFFAVIFCNCCIDSLFAKFSSTRLVATEGTFVGKTCNDEWNDRVKEHAHGQAMKELLEILDKPAINHDAILEMVDPIIAMAKADFEGKQPAVKVVQVNEESLKYHASGCIGIKKPCTLDGIVVLRLVQKNDANCVMNHQTEVFTSDDAKAYD